MKILIETPTKLESHRDQTEIECAEYRIGAAGELRLFKASVVTETIYCDVRGFVTHEIPCQVEFRVFANDAWTGVIVTEEDAIKKYAFPVPKARAPKKTFLERIFLK